MLCKRWREVLRSRPSGAGSKPPQAATVKSRGGERCGKRRDLIPSGVSQRDERKQTADDVSKAYRRCRNRGDVVAPGRVWGMA